MPLRRPRNDSFDNARRMVEDVAVVDVEDEELIKGGIYGIVITGFEGAYRG